MPICHFALSSAVPILGLENLLLINNFKVSKIMVKKLLTFIMGLWLAIGASAQLTTIDPSDVQFWTGTGSNSTVVAIGWDDASASYTPTVVIWGVRWNGDITLLNALDTIAAYDTRFHYVMGSGGFLQQLYYSDPDEGVSLAPSMEWNCNSYGTVYGSTTLSSTHLRISESTCDNYTFTGVSNIIYANDPNAVLSCPKAQVVSVTGITTTDATVNITDATNLNNYTVMLYAGDSLVDSTDIYTQTIYYTTLTANTGYTVKVYSNCSDGTQTASRNATFRTPCVAITHTELPWVEDFQSYNGLSYASSSVSFASQVFCWDLINPYSESDPYINNSSSVNPSGGKCLCANSSTSSPTILVLPPFEDTPDQLQLSFDVLSSYGHGFEAGVITDVNNDSIFTPIALCLPTGSGWNHFDVTFAGLTEGRLALRRNDNSNSYIDNITVREVPSCVKPSQIIVSNITATSADLTVTDPNSTYHYMIYVDGDSVEIYNDSYTLDNLQPNTRYVVNVRTLCSDTTTGLTEMAFRTACGPQAIPYHEDFSQFVDVAHASGYGYAVKDSTLPCWEFHKGRSLDRLELFRPSQSSTGGYGEDGYTLRIYGNNSNSRDILVLPEFDQEINTLEISFMARPSETGSFGGTLQVGYMTDATDSNTFVAVSNYPCAQFASGYSLCASVFPNAPAASHIAVRYFPSGGSAQSWYIDDLDVHDMPACVRAQGISVDSITTESFRLHVIDPMNEGSYRCYYTADAVTDSVDFYDTVYVVDGLAASTDYTISVVTICGDGSLTLPHTTTVSTLCAPVATLPFVENFEDWTASQTAGMNRCWNRLYMNSSSRLVTNNYPYCASGSGNARNGFKSLKMYSKGTSNAIKEYSVAYLPEFSADINTLKVSFFYKYGGSTTNISKVKIAVGVSSSVSDTTTFTRLATLKPTIVGWNEFEVELSGYTGTGNRITIMQTSTGYTDITSYIDSLVVDTVSSCNRPTTLVASDVTAYGATLTWTDPSIADSYIVRWSDGTNADSAIVTGETTYVLTGLTPSTNYTVDVRSICWGTPTAARTASFATSCAPMPLPWSMNFDNITNISQLSSCWNRYTGRYVDSTNTSTLSNTSSGWTKSTTAFDGSSHVKLNIYGTACKYWLLTPEIDLTEDAELSFDYMLTAYNNTNAPQTGSGLEDDRFVVLATTDNGATWVPVAKWGSDTERDDYPYSALTNTVSHAAFSLAAYTGQVVRLAFYGESTVDGPDNDFRIDNIVVAAQGGTPQPPTPVEATIAASDILYWVGEGSDSAIFVISNGENTRAWGYLFDENDEPTALNMASAIAAADPRLVYDMDWTTFEMGISYKEGATVIKIPDTRFKVNGVLAAAGDMLSDYDIEDGMMVVVSSDTNAVWATPIVPATVKHMPVNSTIAASDILYWVGEGTNEAVVVVNWGEPDTALAWGLRFSSTTTIANAIDAIAAADPRVSTDRAHSTINFTEGNVNLSFQPAPASYMQFIIGDNSNVNSTTALDDGDLLKIGESAYGTGYDSTEYAGMWFPMGVVWNTEIHPVSVPGSDSTIVSDSIRYWVGTGANNAIVEIAWEENGVSLAWGVHFDEDYYPSTIDLLDSIDTYDPRFDYHVNYHMSTPYNISSITFVEGDLSLSQTNTSNIVVRCLTSFGDIDPISGDELEDYSIWPGDTVQISTSGLYNFSAVVPVNPPAVTPEPQPIDTLCSTVHNLPYEMDFSGYTDDQSMRVSFASAPVPECWTLFGNGRFHQNYDTTATASIYFGGIGYATSTNNFGCMEVGNPYLALIVCQNYDGTYENAINNARMYGNKRYAVLPGFDHPLNQTMLTFNHRTTLHSGAELRVGYIVNDTSDFVALDTIPADYRVTHNDTVRFTQHVGIPADARLTFLWMSTDTAHTGDYPSNYFCGLDNLVVALDTASAPIDTVTPEPPVAVDATIDSSDILFWVGTGSNHAILAVNWADTALAWGYRFEADTVLSETMLADIAAVDPRFSIVGTGYVADLNYIDTATGMTDTLGITANNYWSSLLNGYSDQGTSQVLHNGDFQKWGDPAVGVVVDSISYGEYGIFYINVFPMTIHPVSVPDTTGSTPEPPQPEHGPFCGAVGTEGCDAIKADSSAFVAWATGITVVRGPRDISNPNSQPATTGADSNALGMPTLSNTSDVVCLGDGGMATLTFARPIRNGEGPDFAVFENSFGDSFLELAFVEVSSDGERFVRFPATSLTPTDVQTDTYGSTDPTMINNLAGKYRIGYGTPFDLEELRDSTGIDIDSIVYVRVIDVVGSVDPQYATYDAFGHMVNDPWPTPFPAGGFDLTGVGVIHELIDSIPIVPEDATIDQNDILFWTGNGANKAVIAVNWAAPDTCLAWGVKWEGTATLKALMDTIAAYDSRFTYTASGSMLSDIVYTIDGLTLRLTTESSSQWGNYWMFNVNGSLGMSYFDALQVQNDDFVKWGDPNSGTSIGTDAWGSDILVWTTMVTPVSRPTTGIDDVVAAIESLWPNPTADYVNVSVSRTIEAVLYDLSGRRMATYTLNEGNNTLDLSALQSGVYMLRTEGMVSKIVKK